LARISTGFEPQPQSVQTLEAGRDTPPLKSRGSGVVFRFSGSEFRVYGFGFRVQGCGRGVRTHRTDEALVYRGTSPIRNSVQTMEGRLGSLLFVSWVSGFASRVPGSGFRVSGVGLRLHGALRVVHLWRDKWTALSGPLSISGPLSGSDAPQGRRLGAQLSVQALEERSLSLSLSLSLFLSLYICISHTHTHTRYTARTTPWRAARRPGPGGGPRRALPRSRRPCSASRTF